MIVARRDSPAVGCEGGTKELRAGPAGGTGRSALRARLPEVEDVVNADGDDGLAVGCEGDGLDIEAVSEANRSEAAQDTGWQRVAVAVDGRASRGFPPGRRGIRRFKASTRVAAVKEIGSPPW